MFSDRFLQEVADKNEIADLVSGYVKLSKRSGKNLFGLCPFHNEKTPSFSVNADGQFYHCFGCGKGGGVINFVMEMENLPFTDAVAFLAKRAGIPIVEDEDDGAARLRGRILSMNREAARFYYEKLMSPSGEPARRYLTTRGISPKTAKNFGLGFAPDSWSELTEELKGKGYSELELTSAGLSKKSRNGNSVYDTFRNRLMFPVIDIRGEVIAFSGRALGETGPKYLNSPETPVFSKSRNLYALNAAKKSKSGYIILTEGNIDVIALHQSGFDSAVASLGTSLTPEQARLISRFSDQVVIAYDSDAAGIKASLRAISILEKLNMTVRVLELEGAKDPDEYLSMKGADAFRNLLERSENHIEYRLRGLSSKHDISTAEGKVGFVKEASALLAELSGSVEREVYSMKVADILGVSVDGILSDVERARKRRLSRQKNTEDTNLTRPVRTAQPVEKGLTYEDVRSAAAEEGLIRILFLDPTLIGASELPDPSEFSSPLLGKIYAEVLRRGGSGALSVGNLSGTLEQDEMSHFTRILQKPEAVSSREKALNDYIEIISKNSSIGMESVDLNEISSRLREKKGYGG